MIYAFNKKVDMEYECFSQKQTTFNPLHPMRAAQSPVSPPDTSQPDEFIFDLACFDDKLFSPQFVSQSVAFFCELFPLGL